jgi:hypothetical protein
MHAVRPIAHRSRRIENKQPAIRGLSETICRKQQAKKTEKDHE